MSWKNILKATLPENLGEAGEPVDYEKRKQLDEWGEKYESDVVRQLRERYNDMDGGYREKGALHITPTHVIFSPFNRKVKRTYDEFANDVKAFIRDVFYDPQKFNYGFELKSKAKIPNNIVGALQMKTSYANTYGDWLQSKGQS